MAALMEILELRTRVNLGIGARERAAPQDVDFDIALDFPAPPKACATDRIGDTVNYDRVCRTARATAEARHYRTVEALTECVLEAVCTVVQGRAGVRVTAHKLEPPVAGLRGGVRFTLDRPAGT